MDAAGIPRFRPAECGRHTVLLLVVVALVVLPAVGSAVADQSEGRPDGADLPVAVRSVDPDAPPPEPPAESRPDPVERERHGDWERRCGPASSNGEGDRPPGRACYLAQTVGADGQDAVMEVLIARDETGEAAVALFILPLSVYLPTGLAFHVDGRPAARLRFQRCMPGGCHASTVLDAPLVGQLKAGQKATVTVHDGKGRARRLAVSLMGFTKGFESL